MCLVNTETITAPVWVYLYDGETPNGAAYIGGAIIVVAVVGHSIATMLVDDVRPRKDNNGVGRDIAAEVAP